uniref:Interferon stimulated exonuclease gene n=1 Tax=Cyclopterus lumpus TaxID=8103 RepID=A0A8C2WCF5_CYCLU
MLRVMQNAKKRQQSLIAKRKTTDDHNEHLGTNKLVKKAKSGDANQERRRSPNPENKIADVSKPGLAEPKPAEPQSLVSALRDSWEMDSGFSSEASPPASGRSSPYLGAYLGACPTAVVALDCEMVGTGPGGRHSELARCSVLGYHGNVLYDKYVRPCRPVTDYRTRWSGIQRHHLQDAIPFAQAREEILGILKGKVVVGHSIYNDFEVLDVLHPGHMVRDTCTMRLLSRLAGFPSERCTSLKILATRLLNRKIQVGRRGHCSVEDALASLDLYKLVEGEWESERVQQCELKDDDLDKKHGHISDKLNA